MSNRTITDAAFTEHIQAVELTAQRRENEPFHGLDVEGFVARPDLGSAERRAFLSILPRKSLWPDVAELDRRIAELQQRHTEAQERARGLSEQRADAPQRDAELLAAWELDHQGRRPEPTTEALDHELAAAERERKHWRSRATSCSRRKPHSSPATATASSTWPLSKSMPRTPAPAS
jgi:hypothetical protein